MRTGETWEERWRKKYETDEIREDRGGHINSQLWVSRAEGKEGDEAVMVRDQRGFCSRQPGYKAAVYFLGTLKDSNQFPLLASNAKQSSCILNFSLPSAATVPNISCQSHMWLMNWYIVIVPNFTKAAPHQSGNRAVDDFTVSTADVYSEKTIQQSFGCPGVHM